MGETALVSLYNTADTVHVSILPIVVWVESLLLKGDCNY
jgi:hypothetical protein